MASRELHSILEESFVFKPKLLDVNTTLFGNIAFNMEGFESAEFIAFTVDEAGDGSFLMIPRHGDVADLGEHVDVPANEIVGSIPTLTGVGELASFGYIGKKQFLSLDIAVSGTTTGRRVGVMLAIDTRRHTPPA